MTPVSVIENNIRQCSYCKNEGGTVKVVISSMLTWLYLSLVPKPMNQL